MTWDARIRCDAPDDPEIANRSDFQMPDTQPCCDIPMALKEKLDICSCCDVLRD
jgi:hypothetical protein